MTDHATTGLTRRRVLAALAAGSAGCSGYVDGSGGNPTATTAGGQTTGGRGTGGRGSDDSTATGTTRNRATGETGTDDATAPTSTGATTETTDPTAAERPTTWPTTVPAPAGGHPDLAVVDVTGATGIVDLTVEVVEAFTPDHPGAVRVDVENLTDDRTITHRGDLPVDPWPVVRSGGGGAVVPIPADGEAVVYPCEGEHPLHPESPVDGCWQYPYATIGANDMGGGVVPGETATETYQVYDFGADQDCGGFVDDDAFSDDRCLVAGDYRVEQAYDLLDHEESVTLGFTLRLSY